MISCASDDEEATAMGTLRFADLQTRPTALLDLTSLTIAEFQQLVPPFEATFQAHMAEWRLDGQLPCGPPVPHLPELSTADPGGSLAVYPGLPENLCLASHSGTPLRDGPRQGPSVDACPLGGLADDAAYARRGSQPVLNCTRPPNGASSAPRIRLSRRAVRGARKRATRSTTCC